MASAIPVVGARLAAMATAMGTTLTAIAPLAVAALALGLIFDDVAAYLAGDVSMLGALAESAGVDSEAYAALSSLRDLGSAVGDVMAAAGGAIMEGLGGALAWLGQQIPSLQGPIDWLTSRIEFFLGANATLSGFLTNLSRGAQVAAQVAGRAASNLRGEDVSSQPAVRAAAGRLGEIEAQRQAMRATQTTVAPNITINAPPGLDEAMLARKIRDEVGQMVVESSSQVVGG
jgi:hypothetical protein